MTLEVWLARTGTPGDGAALEAMLGSDECARLRHTESASMHRQRLIGYALRRVALGRVLGVAPRDVPLCLDADGRAVVAGASGWGGALSHSDGMAAFASCGGARVGIDVERVRPRRGLVALARRCFHPAEASWVEAAAADQREETFFRLWTVKESFAKASGRDLFAVLPERVGSGGGWHVVPFDGAGAHVGAVTAAVPTALSQLVYSVTIVDNLEADGQFDTLSRTVAVSRLSRRREPLERGEVSNGSS